MITIDLLDKEYIDAFIEMLYYVNEHEDDFDLWLQEKYKCTINDDHPTKLIVTFHSKEQFVLFKLENMQ